MPISRLELSRRSNRRGDAARRPDFRRAVASIGLLGLMWGLLPVVGDAVAQSPAENAAAPAPTDAPASGDTAASAAPSPAAIPSTVEQEPALAPYVVLIRLNIPVSARIDAVLRDQIRAGIAVAVRSGMGQMWTTTVELTDDPWATSAAALSAAPVAQLTDEFAAAGYDKVFVTGVALLGSRWTLLTREWDAASRTAGTVHETTVHDPRLVAPLSADLVMRAFRPVVRVEDVDGTQIVTSIRAGEFPPADPEYVPFAEGRLLTPFIRYYDRDRNLLEIRELPWTYLQVDSINRARMECHTVSAYRTPLSGSRRRMEIMAIAAQPVFATTRLVIAPRGNATDPLPGCRVEVLNRLPTAEDPVEDRLQLLTDRRGSIVIHVDPEHPLQHVLVHSGKALLARVPLIPGLEETMTLAIPDDSTRLSVEGSLSVLEGELIDAVARRPMLMARARRASKAGNWDQVNAFIRDLKAIDDYEAFSIRLNELETEAVTTANKARDKVAEARIRKMCSDLRQLASGYLDSEKIREFENEMAELKAVTK